MTLRAQLEAVLRKHGTTCHDAWVSAEDPLGKLFPWCRTFLNDLLACVPTPSWERLRGILTSLHGSAHQVTGGNPTACRLCRLAADDLLAWATGQEENRWCQQRTTPPMTPPARARLKARAENVKTASPGMMMLEQATLRAACSPDIVLSLLADLERMEGVVEAIRCQSEPKPAGAGYCNLPDESAPHSEADHLRAQMHAINDACRAALTPEAPHA